MNIAPYHLNLFGLFLDIIGVFLLSVEAIKLPNLRKLRVRFFVPLDSYISPAKVPFAKSLRKAWKTGKEPKVIVVTAKERAKFRRSFRHFYISHSLAGFIGTLIALSLVQASGIDLWSLIQHELRIAALTAALILFTTILLLFLFDSAADVYGGTPIPFFISAVLTVTWPPLLIFMILGELLHQTSILVTKLTIRTLDLIHEKAPNGTIGIIGFVFASLGFLFQFIGTWAAVK